MGTDRALVVAGGLAGLAGVALAAVAAHATGPGALDTAARFLLAHAPALLAVSVLGRTELVHAYTLRLGGLGLMVGLLLFCGDLSLRALAGLTLLPMAAPAGGLLLMAGWALVAASALFRPR